MLCILALVRLVVICLWSYRWECTLNRYQRQTTSNEPTEYNITNVQRIVLRLFISNVWLLLLCGVCSGQYSIDPRREMFFCLEKYLFLKTGLKKAEKHWNVSFNMLLLCSMYKILLWQHVLFVHRIRCGFIYSRNVLRNVSATKSICWLIRQTKW